VRLPIGILLAGIFLTGCAHRQDPNALPYITPSCPATAQFIKGRTKCEIGPDGQKWCNGIRVIETCSPAKPDANK